MKAKEKETVAEYSVQRFDLATALELRLSRDETAVIQNRSSKARMLYFLFDLIDERSEGNLNFLWRRALEVAQLFGEASDGFEQRSFTLFAARGSVEDQPGVAGDRVGRNRYRSYTKAALK